MKKRIALAGNPNVGKSTIFNALTGMHQHTGNWPGKTVTQAIGEFKYKNKEYELIDLPGTYSLISHSDEETVARNFLCFDNFDAVIVVCDSLCLERNLNLVLQILEITPNVIVCVNLLDEARKKKVIINLELLEKKLGVSVVGTEARSKKGINRLLDKLDEIDNEKRNVTKVRYKKEIEEKIKEIEKFLEDFEIGNLSKRWLSLRLIEKDEILIKEIDHYLGDCLSKNKKIKTLLKNENPLEKDYLVSEIMKKAENISKEVVIYENNDYERRSRKIDKILTNKLTGIPIMLVMLMIIFWLTITGANYPSQVLFNLFSDLETYIIDFFIWINAPNWINNLVVGGIYRTLSWVVSVMLPPMAIFFPLFTLLEDLGVLPRIAFNLDKAFQKCCACGKQALCMMMGFGCNAAGIIGTRIIDSKRERLIAIITNNFVPCNGRFPTIIVMISMFLIGVNNNKFTSLIQVFFLTLVILLGILITFLISYLLSKTLLKGVPSSFTLELPPYRKPQIMKVIIRSIFDKTLHVLSRAIIVTIPAGTLIWLLANIDINSVSILEHINNLLDPFGRIIGLDGVILTAFILGFPANEIVIPIMLMSYLSLGTITDYESIFELKNLLVDNGWTTLTAINMIILTLMHFPCSTTCLTIKKETGSIKWMLYSMLIPTICGITLCLLTTIIFKLL